MHQIPLDKIEADLLEIQGAAVRTQRWDDLEAVAFRWENLAHRRWRELCGTWRIPPSPRSEGSGEVYLLTGGAGFIGSHVARCLLERGDRLVLIDDFNDYYDPTYKYRNLESLLGFENLTAYELDFRDDEALQSLFRRHSIDHIVHLGARAGVRASLDDPQLYVTANVLGTQNLLEMARRHEVKSFVYASSSSVYGGSETYPFSESQRVDEPISPYAATKKSNEVQAACYSRLFGVPVTGLRFFTVYGGGGRPDMAIRRFIELIDRDQPVPMFGDGSFERDFTYIDDIVDGVMQAVAVTRGKQDWIEVFNLGESDTNSVRRMILLIATELGKIDIPKPVMELTEAEEREWIDRLTKKGLVETKPHQLGDVPKTYADISKSREILGYDPQVKLAEGIKRTVAWHLEEKKRRATDEGRRFWRAVGRYADLRMRSALDSFARPRDPRFTEDDLRALEEIRRELFAATEKEENRCLSTWLLAGSAAALGEVAAYLRSAGPVKPWGLNGLAIHRKRRRIIQTVRDAGEDRLSAAEENLILRLAREVIGDTAPRETAIVVAAAGYGTRIAGKVGGYEMKHRVFLGDEMLLLSLRNMIPFSKKIVVVASETNRPDIQALLERSEIVPENGFDVDYVIQEERYGDGDAHLTAGEILDDFPGIILFVFGDAPTKSPATIEKMMLLKAALGKMAPVIIPALAEEKPYSPIVLAPDGRDRGRVLWNWQKADENDFPGAAEARSRWGLRNVGIFAAENDVFEGLRWFKEHVFPDLGRWKTWEVKKKELREGEIPKPPEFGFADLMKVFPQRGIEVLTPTFARETDKLNVNRPEDIESVLELCRERSPFARVEVEKHPATSTVTVRMLDLSAEKERVVVNGVPSVRHCARLRFEGKDLASPEVEEKVNGYIQEIRRRLESEIGIKTIAVGRGLNAEG